MTLDEFMQAHRLSARDVAERVGVGPEAVRKWLRGERIPRPAQMTRIHEISAGAVQPATFYPAPRPTEAA